MNAFGFIILIMVAVSSDVYRERSTHLGVTLLGSLLVLANLPQVCNDSVQSLNRYLRYRSRSTISTREMELGTVRT